MNDLRSINRGGFRARPITKKIFYRVLEPLEFLERIAAFIPYPRRHRRHYHGVFAPNSPLRKKVAVQAQQFTKPDMKQAAEKAHAIRS